MDEKRKIIFAILGAGAFLFFMATRFYQPVLKDNHRLEQEYKELRNKVKGWEDFSEQRIANILEKMNKVAEQLDEKIPPLGQSWDFIGQLTVKTAQLGISFSEINRRLPEEKDGYRVSSIDIVAKTTLDNFLRYLEFSI